MKIIELSKLLSDEIAKQAVRGFVRKIAPFYEATDVHIAPANLAIEEIVPLARFAVRKRLLRQRRAIEMLKAAAIDRFDPCIVSDDSGALTLVLPPIVERTRHTHLIDGTHRLLAAREMGYNRLRVLQVVARSLPPLPCDPVTLDSVQVVDHQKALEEILVPYRKEYFREATTYLNSVAFKFNSVDTLEEACLLMSQRESSRY
ncbi:MAG: hypothetical protein ACRD8U_01775 [Pyrinomonadaceae bacterium]